MSLRAAIAEATTLPQRFRSPLPERTAVQKSAAKLSAPDFETALADGEPDVAFLARMRLVRTSGSFSSVRRRDLSRLLDLGWSKPEDAELVAHAVARVEREDSRRLDRALVGAYLRRFPRAHPAFPLLVRALASVLGRGGETWRAAATWNLFDPQLGPVTLARAALARPPSQVFESAGLAGELASGRYGEAVFRAACDVVAESGSNEAEPAVRNLLRVRSSLQDFAGQRAFFARSLLKPWTSTHPSVELRETLRSILTDRSVLGDPRLDPSRWDGLLRELAGAFPNEDPENLLRVLRGWLVQSTVRQFLAVVDATAKSDIWPYRKAFWMAYLDHELIQDAWVVFGTKAAAVARSLDGASSKTTPYGKLGSGASPAHSVLILQIGDLLIGDWSHHGACRFWTKRSRYRPKMHQHAYEVEPLRTVDWSAGDQALAHHGSDTYGWQERFRAHIARETGIRERFSNGREWRPS